MFLDRRRTDGAGAGVGVEPGTAGGAARAAGSTVPESPPGVAGPEPTTRRVAIFVVIAVALLMSSLDQTIVATALHPLQHGLDTSVAWAGWTITAYSLGLVLSVSLSGKLCDRYGRRRVFLTSVVVFSAASLCCGLVDNIYLLIALRVLQAIGGGGFTPSATAIIVDHFGDVRDKAVGLFGAVFPIGAMLGPVLGGVLVATWSWRAVFFVNVPIGVVLFGLGLRLIPADRPAATRRRAGLDLVGMAQLGVGLLAAMITVTALGDGDVHPWELMVALPGVVSLVAFVMFARHIGRNRDPFIPRRFIVGRGFGAVNLVNVVYSGAVDGMVALIPLYAITRYHIGVLGSGTLLTAASVADLVLSVIAAGLLRRTGYRGPLYLGALVAAVGMFALALAPPVGSPYLWLAFSAGLIGVGVGWSSPATRNACLQLEPGQSATLAALKTTGYNIGSIAAVAIATAIVTQASDHAGAQAWVYAMFALVLIVALPVISRVPEHRGSW